MTDDVRFLGRPVRDDDHPYLFQTFLREYRRSDHTGGIPNDEFYALFKQQWALVLQHFTVLVAHPETDENEIAGFIAYHIENARSRYPIKTIAWIATKRTPWGKLGVAKMLMRAAGFATVDQAGKFVPMTDTLWVLYGSSFLMQKARARGWRVELVPATQSLRLLMGVA